MLLLAMFLKVFVCLVFVLVKYQEIASSEIGNICRHEDDSCVDVWMCPFFADLLNRIGKPIPRWVIKLTREYYCGHQGNTPKVCCPTLSPPPQAEDYGTQVEPPDVTNHQNIKLLPLETCGPIYNEYRITHGSKALPMEFPWMALIAYKAGNSIDFRCGGAVLNERYVLTAAHCIQNSTIGVRLGEHNINTDRDCNPMKDICAPPVQDFYYEDILIHPEYVPHDYRNDIALIRLATPVNFSYENIQPICLPIGPLAKVNLDEKFTVISGWGITGNGFKSPELQKVSVPVIPLEKCRSIYRKYPISYKQICAGGYLGRDSCSGDSGSPLKYIGHVDGTARFIQYGIVSFGPAQCGTEGQPGVYTRVSYYMKWILDNLKPD